MWWTDIRRPWCGHGVEGDDDYRDDPDTCEHDTGRSEWKKDHCPLPPSRVLVGLDPEGGKGGADSSLDFILLA